MVLYLSLPTCMRMMIICCEKQNENISKTRRTVLVKINARTMLKYGSGTTLPLASFLSRNTFIVVALSSIKSLVTVD